MSRVAILLLWLLHFLPLQILAPIGQGIGMLIFWFVPKRRKIARINIALCFPEMSAREQERLVRRHFRCFGRGIVEAGIAWWSTPRRLLRIVKLEGKEHMDALGGEPCVGLAPHFVGLELEGLRFTYDYRGASMYVRQKDPHFDIFLKAKRERFEGSRLISRQDGIKPIVRWLRAGRNVLLYPDMDFGVRDSVFAPFFGIQASTITGMSRLAKLTGKTMLPTAIRQLPGGGGYVLKFYAPLENYPSDDEAADAARMNAFIEERVREMPEQYLWTHRRFKTRPAGEAKIY